MLTRGRAENHVHVITDDLTDDREFELPGITEQLTATEILERALARDGAAVSATCIRERAVTPETRLHDAATRYADTVSLATRTVLGASAEEPVGSGPLPWLPDVPVEVAGGDRTPGALIRLRPSQRAQYLQSGQDVSDDQPGS